MIKAGTRVKDDTVLQLILDELRGIPRFGKGGKRASPKEIKQFIYYWFFEIWLPENGKETTYAEQILEVFLPESPWTEVEDVESILETKIPNIRVYERLMKLSPLYKVATWEQFWNNWDYKTPQSLILQFIKEIPVRPGKGFFLGAKLQRERITGRATLSREVLTALAARPDFRVTRDWVRRFDLDGSDIETIYRGRFGENYTERYAPTPGVQVATGISNQLPDYVRDVLAMGDSVLSGGSLLKIVTGGFSPTCDLLKDKPRELENIFSLMGWTITAQMQQDYDIYTTQAPGDVYKLLAKHGFRWVAEVNNPDTVVFDPNYSSWLLRMVRGEEHVDVIFTNMYYDINYRPPERPQDFIVKEFDIDVTKIWFDGQDVWAPNEKIARGIVERKMELDFHPNMVINTHKTATTMDRLYKYYCRGFEIDVRDRRSFDRFLDAYTKRSVSRHFFNPWNGRNRELAIVELVERYLRMVSPMKDQILAYNNYYIRSRNDLYFDETPIPRTPEVARPEGFRGLIQILETWLDFMTEYENKTAVDNLFVQYLGIHVYNIAGGVVTSFSGGHTDSLPYMEPFVLADIGYLARDDTEKPRRARPVPDDLPECRQIFAPKPQSSKEFKENLLVFRDLCNQAESQPPCKQYLDDMHGYIVGLYNAAFTNSASRLPTLNTVRGMELFAAYENVAEHVGVSHDRVYVRYANEPGIDAGGLRKEFYVNVCRQMRPLFSYINPGGDDPRMYISDAPNSEIIRALNEGFRENQGYDEFGEWDLNLLYYMAGKMFADAFINRYSTELPLSRVLLSTMLSKDLGVSVEAMKTAYLMEQEVDDFLERLYFYNMDNPKESEDELDTLAIDRYFGDSQNPKFQYVSNFIQGFSSMTKVLNVFHLTIQELFSTVCSSNVTREAFENYIRSPATSFILTYRIDDDTSSSEMITATSDPLYSRLKDKLLRFLFEDTDNLVSLLHMNFEEQFPRDLSKTQTLIRYYQLVIEGITNLNVLDTRKKITFRFVGVSQAYAARTTQIDFHVHNCFDEVEISTAWFERTDLQEWLLVSNGAFLDKKYSSA